MEKAKKVEAQNIDPELEFELQKSRDLKVLSSSESLSQIK
jgi:hypothetical protein